MSYVNGEIALRKWMTNKDTLGCSGQRGTRDLGELVSSDYPIFGALIWCGELTGLALLFLTGSKTTLFELRVGDWCTLYLCMAITPNYHPHKSVRQSWLGRLGGSGCVLLWNKWNSYVLSTWECCLHAVVTLIVYYGFVCCLFVVRGVWGEKYSPIQPTTFRFTRCRGGHALYKLDVVGKQKSMAKLGYTHVNLHVSHFGAHGANR